MKRAIPGENPALRLAATYRREVEAGIDRVWENVFDWEHLPALHAEYFSQVRLLETTPDGWIIAATRASGERTVLELAAERARARYCVHIRKGQGAGSEIWTLLAASANDRTAVEVGFYLPAAGPQKLAALGQAYCRAYARLWDEDEAMMRRRDALAGWTANPLPHPVPLGPVAELRRQLPLTLEINGTPFRILALDDGEIVAHSTICPHRRGPLDAALPQGSMLRCPWHGYRFDLRTGESADGGGCRIRPTVHVDIDPGSREAVLRNR